MGRPARDSLLEGVRAVIIADFKVLQSTNGFIPKNKARTEINHPWYFQCLLVHRWRDQMWHKFCPLVLFFCQTILLLVLTFV